jgi:hypothetical protein
LKENVSVRAALPLQAGKLYGVSPVWIGSSTGDSSTSAVSKTASMPRFHDAVQHIDSGYVMDGSLVNEDVCFSYLRDVAALEDIVTEQIRNIEDAEEVNMGRHLVIIRVGCGDYGLSQTSLRPREYASTWWRRVLGHTFMREQPFKSDVHAPFPTLPVGFHSHTLSLDEENHKNVITKTFIRNLLGNFVYSDLYLNIHPELRDIVRNQKKMPDECVAVSSPDNSWSLHIVSGIGALAISVCCLIAALRKK